MKIRSNELIGLMVLVLCAVGAIVVPIAYGYEGQYTLTNNAQIFINVSNIGGVKYPGWDNSLGDNATYWISMLNSSGGGLNPLHISTNYSIYNGQVTTTTNHSGTFYCTFNGGIGHMDDGVLMLAVNGTIPSDFSVNIQSQGYNWTPATTPPYNTTNPPNPTVYNYNYSALNETFYPSDFLYTPQIWKPCSEPNFEIYNGQDMKNSTNTFRIMFIDLNAGAFNYATFGNSSLINQGAIQVKYSFNDLPAGSYAAFNDYGWFSACNWGPGIPMTNNDANNGYVVVGTS